MHRCFGMGSYSDQGNGYERPVIGLSEDSGLLEYDTDWDSFYGWASADDGVHLVKTHQHPCDDQPAIVIIRDPRLSICSYYYYLRKNWTAQQFSMEDIARGDVFYGDWQEFYGKWLDRRPGSTLLVYFDELADLAPSTVQRISAFVGTSPVQSGGVDFEPLQRMNPDFFRRGKSKWEGDENWTPEAEAVFQERFSGIMRAYGFS